MVRLKNYLKESEKAYFTLEASLIIPMVLLFITLMIFMSFYSYDRSVLEHFAYEAALRGCGSHVKTNLEAQQLAQKAAGSLVEDKLFALKDFRYSADADANKVTVNYEGTVNMPFITWLGEYVPDIDFSIKVKKTANRLHRTKTIRICRRINNLLKEFEE